MQKQKKHSFLILQLGQLHELCLIVNKIVRPQFNTCFLSEKNIHAKDLPGKNMLNTFYSTEAYLKTKLAMTLKDPLVYLNLDLVRLEDILGGLFSLKNDIQHVAFN
ncbi:hypothetical protein ACJX0J_013454, partial [Zea mays]